MNMKEKEIVIHIGMHKTGTTSIQRTLNKHLNDPDFAYVNLSNPNHSKPIFTLFEEKGHPSINKMSEQEIEKTNILTKKSLMNTFNASKDKTLIISGESIRGISKNGLMRFKAFLEEYFKKITIVAYIRAPKGYMESAFQQIIKDGADHFDLEKVYPNYQKFKQFHEVFGKENVKLWKFDPKTFPNGNVVLDFCQRLGITKIPKIIITDNESISKEALSLLYIYRKYGPGYGNGLTAGQENHRLIKELSGIGGNKIRFSPELIRPILRKHRKDIEWMESILNESLSEELLTSENSIESEADLLTVSPETIKKLKNINGEAFLEDDAKTNTREEIEKLIQILHKKRVIKKNQITYIEIAQKMQKEKPEFFANMNEKRISRIVKETLDIIKNELTTSEGTVSIPGFGKFSVDLLKEGEKNIKNIQFTESKT